MLAPLTVSHAVDLKLGILCCNRCINTSVVLRFPAHHGLSARVHSPLRAARACD